MRIGLELLCCVMCPKGIKHGLTPESPAALQKAYEKYLEERRAKRKRDMWGDGKDA
jgi:hypothetical protein